MLDREQLGMGDQIELRIRDKYTEAAPGRWWELDHIKPPVNAHVT